MLTIVRSHLAGAIATLALATAGSMVAIPALALAPKQDSPDAFDESACELVQDAMLRSDCFHAEGLERHEQGDLQGAVEAYTRSLQINPRHSDSYYNRGVAYHALGLPEDAIADYSQAIALNARDEDAFYNRALARYDLGDIPGARADFTATLGINPDAQDARRWLDYIQHNNPQ
jgi:tetratricopeptide (TPR) repeat protein